MPAQAPLSFQATGVNLKATGDTTLLAAQSGKIFVPHHVVIRCVTFSGLGSHAQASIGNGTTKCFDARQVTAGANGVNECKVWTPDFSVDSAGFAVSISSAALRLTVDSAATHTTHTADFEVVGTVR